MDWKLKLLNRHSLPQPGESDYFLPDLCRGEGLLAIVVIAELLALLIVVSESGLQFFDWVALGKVSMLSLWITLLSALVLCKARRYLGNSHPVRVALLSYLMILSVALACSGAGEWLLISLENPGGARQFSVWRIVEHTLIAAIPAGILLRYLFLQQQLRVQQRAELESRIQALQSRIRPHFLFNSMNMIASLIGSDPVKAERVVEDLSDLFRHALTGTQTLVPLREELALCRRYLALEKMRLGDRLNAVWKIDDYGSGVQIPCLSLQPILENAVYHGIQLLPDGGEIEVRVKRQQDKMEITVTNPRNPRMQHHKGSKMSMQNVQRRLEAHFGPTARVSAEALKNCYITRVTYPVGI